jgi:hypothetical protein
MSDTQTTTHAAKCPKCSTPLDVTIEASIHLPEIEPLPKIAIAIASVAPKAAAPKN